MLLYYIAGLADTANDSLLKPVSQLL